MTTEQLPLIKGLHSEEDVKAKIVIPRLKELGYTDSQLFFEVPIKAYLGRQSKIVYADIVVKEQDQAIIIIEVKKPGIQLDEIEKEQAISYARQFSPRVVPIAVVTNGILTKVYDVRTKKQIHDIPKKSEILSFLAEIHISNEEREEAGQFIIEGYQSVQEIKAALDRCHDILRSNEGFDPITSFDEVNKLIYAKMQEEKRATQTKTVNRFTSEYIKNATDPLIEINRVFEDASAMLRENRIFETSDIIKLSRESIIAIVKILEQKAISQTREDIVGLAYESFLPTIFRGERLGQYFTPDRIKDFMLDILEPRIGHLIIDPAFGSGGFLVMAYKRLLENLKRSGFDKERIDLEKKKLTSDYLYGTEITARLALACKTNMYLHGDGRTHIYHHDGLVDFGDIYEGKFDIVVTNPPFGAPIDRRDILDRFDLGIGRLHQQSDVLFLERCIKLAKLGTGRIGIVLPESILMNTTYQYVRDWVDEHATIDAIFKLPNYAFKPAGKSGISASLVFMTHKKPETREYPIFMARVDRISFDTNNRPDADYFPLAFWHYREYLSKGRRLFDDDMCYVVNRSDGELLSVNYFKPKYIRLLKEIHEKQHVRLGDLCVKTKYAIVDGPFGTQLHVSDYKKEGVPVIRVKNIGLNEFIDDDLVYISKEKHKELGRSRVRENDIIIAKTGATFGKACLFPSDKFDEANITASCCKISIDPEKANPYFIAELINAPIIHEQLARYSEKSAQPGFNLIELRKILVPVVPKGAQDRIAASIRKRKELINQLKLRINEESSLIREEIDIL
jgi:type I restriction enzyme M protein